jgi:hypothetical protein
MHVASLRFAAWTIASLALLSLEACANEEVVHTCVVQEDCPASLSCLQQVCESITLPHVQVRNPEDGLIYPWNNDGMGHTQIVDIRASDLVLRPLAESSERVLGEGHLVVFVDEVEVATIDSGDLSEGVQVEITIDDTPGVHRLRVQARLNDGTDYDNREGSVRNLMWVDDGRPHVALRLPWPGDAFSHDEQIIDGDVAAIGDGISIGSNSGQQHTFIFYDSEPFDECLMNRVCFLSYVGVVPNDEDPYGPIWLEESAANTGTLTVQVMNFDHTPYMYTDEMGMQQRVHSSIEIVRTDDAPAGQR